MGNHSYFPSCAHCFQTVVSIMYAVHLSRKTFKVSYKSFTGFISSALGLVCFLERVNASASLSHNVGTTAHNLGRLENNIYEMR